MTVYNETKQIKDTAANFTSNNPTLTTGVIAHESDTGKIKIGDGSTAWTALAYTNLESSPYPSDVPAGIDQFEGSAGISITKTLANAAGRILKGVGTMTAPAMEDGYGISEIELDITGSPTKHAAAASAWVNINAGTVPPGNYVCARNDGVYEEAAATITNAKIIFGARMQMIAGDSDALRFPFSINTNNTAITALIDCNNFSDLGSATGKSIQATFVPFLRNAAGTIMYLPLYA